MTPLVAYSCLWKFRRLCHEHYIAATEAIIRLCKLCEQHGSKKVRAGRGTVGKTAVAGVKDRTTNQVSLAVIEDTSKPTLQWFLGDRVADDATVYTDEHRAYEGLPHNHHAVKHSMSQYVDGMAHTNGRESFPKGKGQ